jgi:2-amino-4-hydroxy-6-hydroxymethyldihydropteridine diphosphokinase
MPIIYFSLGSNLGDRKGNLEKALNELLIRGIKILRKSRVYETEPLLVKNQPWFLNMAVKAKCKFEPDELLKLCKKIEKKMGRDFSVKRYGPRVIDIDILFYGSLVFKSRDLIIPHPMMHERRFVLEPLCEIAPRKIHPVFKKTVKKLLQICIDKSIVDGFPLSRE